MTTAFGEPTNPAAGLFQIAGLVEAGYPAPRLTSVNGRDVVAHVDVADLPEWVIRLDLPAPDWQIVEIAGDLYRVAAWPERAFASLLFQVVCCDRQAMVPEQIAEAVDAGWLPEVPASCYPVGAVPLPEARS